MPLCLVGIAWHHTVPTKPQGMVLCNSNQISGHVPCNSNQTSGHGTIIFQPNIGAWYHGTMVFQPKVGHGTMIFRPKYLYLDFNSNWFFVQTREHKSTKKPRQPPFAPQLEALLLIAAVAHMIIHLLDPPPPYRGVVEFKNNDFLLVNDDIYCWNVFVWSLRVLLFEM